MPTGYPVQPLKDESSLLSALTALKDGTQNQIRMECIPLGTLSATATFNIFKPPSLAQIVSIDLVTSTALAVDGTNYWSFQILNVTDSASLQSGTGPTTPTGARLTASTYTAGTATTANVAYSMAVNQNLGDLVTSLSTAKVLQLIATKTGTAANLTNCSLFVYYRLIY